MQYAFQFGVVWDNWHRLLGGAVATVRISVAAFALGLVLALCCAYVRGMRPRGAGVRALRGLVRGYVEAIRNTPLLVQLFIIYFSLPGLGIRMDADQAAVLGLGLNFGGYATEILRSGIEAVPRGQTEAATALGLSRWRTFRHVVLIPAIRICYPALAGQFILLLLGSSIVSAISALELTSEVNTLQSTTFRSFEFYFAATFLYFVMAVAFRVGLDGLYWLGFVRGRPAVAGPGGRMEQRQ